MLNYVYRDALWCRALLQKPSADLKSARQLLKTDATSQRHNASMTMPFALPTLFMQFRDPNRAFNFIHLSGPDILSGCLNPYTQLLHTTVPVAQTLVHCLNTSLVKNFGLNPRDACNLINLVDVALQ
jgi:hypothetical protein